MTPSRHIVGHIWRDSLSVAAAFWAVWLALVSVELALGASAALGVLFGLSIPALVVFLICANFQVVLLFDLRRRLLSVTLLGVTVLVTASVITGVGLLATASLKGLFSA